MASRVTTSRRELHDILVSILGSRNVYFQPPESKKLIYPCIVYERSDIKNTDAGNDVYLQHYTYQITVIDSDPDSDIPQKVSNIVHCRFVRHFASDGLNHDVFNCTIQNQNPQ